MKENIHNHIMSISMKLPNQKLTALRILLQSFNSDRPKHDLICSNETGVDYEFIFNSKLVEMPIKYIKNPVVPKAKTEMKNFYGKQACRGGSKNNQKIKQLSKEKNMLQIKLYPKLKSRLITLIANRIIINSMNKKTNQSTLRTKPLNKTRL
ncbi:hypothetical protein BpHYR1_041246, partial [Brachionus plicatilis]